MDGIAKSRGAWVTDRRDRSASDGAASGPEEARREGWLGRAAAAWWRGWAAFTRATGEPYLSLGGRGMPAPAPGADRAEREEVEEERCA